MSKEIKEAFDAAMEDVSEQILNHPKAKDDDFKTSGYAILQSMRTGEPLAMQNVRTGERSNEMTAGEAMLAKELGERIVGMLRDVDATNFHFRVAMAALDHALDVCVNVHDPDNTLDLAMPDDTSPNVRKIADQIMRTTSNNGEVFPENNALACIVVAAGWLACVDDTEHADEIISGLSNVVAGLVHQTRSVSSAAFERDTGVSVDLYTGEIKEAPTPPSKH
jgi:hypothetical protein